LVVEIGINDDILFLNRDLVSSSLFFNKKNDLKMREINFETKIEFLKTN
jgi:hypothetical protein